MSAFTAFQLARIRAALESDPINWGAVRGAAIALSRRDTTLSQRIALQVLKDAKELDDLRCAVDEVGRAFKGDAP